MEQEMRMFKRKLMKYMLNTEEKMKSLQEEIASLKRENAQLKGQEVN